MAGYVIGLELFVDGAWTDITEDLHESGVAVSRGQDGAARMSCQLRNNAGQYSPRNPRSALFGKIGRNTPIRSWFELGEPRLVQDAAGQWYCADSSALDITGDLDLRVDLAMRTWRPAAVTYMGLIKGGAYGLYLNPSGQVTLTWNSDATTGHTITSTVPVPGGITGRKAVRATLDVNNGSGKHVVRFYSSDSLTGTWAQFGASVENTGTTAVYASTQTLGTYTSDPAEVFGIQVRNGIGGTVVAELVPVDEDPDVTSVADGFGNTWQPGDATRARITDRHYLFVGEVSEWPQRWGEKGAPSAYSPIECAGPLRRIGQGSSPVKSTLRRGIEALPSLAAYWPMEEGSSATQFAQFSGPGTGVVQGAISPASYDGFAASDSIPTFDTGRVFLPIRPAAPTGSVQWRFLIHVPSALPDNTLLARFGTSSSLGRIDLLFDADTGGIYANLYSSLNVLGLTTSVLNTSLVDKDMRVSIEAKQNGADVDLTLVTLEEGAPTGFLLGSTKTGITLGAPTYVYLNPGAFDLGGTAIGHVSVQSAISSLFDVASQFRAYTAERADTRLLRLAAENGLSLAVIGVGAGAERMGAQRSAQLFDLLRECAQSDQGLLFEARTDNALRYRTLESLWAQTPAVSLAFGDGSMLRMEPVDDDNGTRNVVTVQRREGGEHTVRITSGPMGTQAPPDGVGVYDESATLSLASDAATRQQAGWRAHLGTVDEARWPSIELDLAHPDLQADPGLNRRLLSVDIGDLIEVTDLPEWLPPYTVRQLVIGSTVTVAATRKLSSPWSAKIEWECVPARPYNVGTWVASSFETATTGTAPTVYASDAFTGSNGAALSGAWTTGYTGTGASTAIQGNKGRWLTGTAGGYAGTARISRILTATTHADGVATFTYTPQGESYPEWYLRASDTVLDTNQGYAVQLPTQGGATTVRIVRYVAYASTELATASFSATSGTAYKVKVQATGTTIRAKVWVATDPEPSAWTVTATDSTHTAAGNWGFSVGAGNTASTYVDLDDFQYDDGGSTSTTVTPLPAGASETRWESGGSQLDAAITPTATTFDVKTTLGPLWTVDDDDFPFEVLVAGEVMSVTDIAGSSSPQTFTVARSVNSIEKSHAADTELRLAEPSYWGARPLGGSSFVGSGGSSGGGGGDTGGGSGGGGTTPNTVRVGSATYALSGVDPGTAGGWGGTAPYPGSRGVDQLIVYTSAYGAATDTNQWGAEAPADGDDLANSIDDRQTTGSTTGTTIPSGGMVLSGHGAARDWILANVTVGALIELIYVAPSTGGGGTGGGGSGGGTVGPWPAYSVCCYHLAYSSTGASPATFPAGMNELRLAFAFDQSGTLKLADNNYIAGQSSWTSALSAYRAAGGKVVASLGGAGNTIDTSSTSAVINEFIAMAATIGGIDALDWDIETGASFPTAAAVAISQGLRAYYGANFGITMAPNGTNVGAYLPAAVQLHQAGLLTWYGQQYYDYGNPQYADIRYRIQEAISAGIPASKLGVGMALTSPAANGFWSQANALSALQQVRAEFGVRRAYLWVEPGTWSSGEAATWANNANSALS